MDNNIIKKETDNIILGLKQSNFFKDYEINDLTYAEAHIKSLISEKVNQGYDITDNSNELFTDEEFDDMIADIIAGSTAQNLKNLNFVDGPITYEISDGKILIK